MNYNSKKQDLKIIKNKKKKKKIYILQVNNMLNILMYI